MGRINVRCAEEKGDATVDVSIRKSNHALGRARRVVKHGRANQLALCSTIMADEQAAAITVVVSLGQKVIHLKRALDTGVSLHVCVWRRADVGAK